MGTKIHVGNALEVLPKLEANSIHCSISSPPYMGLRRYEGFQQCEWPEIEYSPMSGLPPIRILGCDPDCRHEWGPCLPSVSGGGQSDFSTSTLKQDGRPEESRQRTLLQRAKELKRKAPSGAGSYCQKCGGWRGALGNEPTIEMYIGHLVAIYREVYRCLRADGVAFVVMGDSFAGGGGYYPNAPSNLAGSLQAKSNRPTRERNIRGNRLRTGLSQGNLMMVPHRLALALQADGWIIRNDLIFSKKSPMPESVKGWTWQKHRIKIKKSDRATSPYHEAYGDHPQGAGVAARAQREAYYEKGEGAPQWIDCPGCSKCEANPADCPDCLGTRFAWPDPDVPMTDEEYRAHCKANPCLKCNGGGKHGGYVLKRGSWRHTRAHEFVFMMCKKMQYFADQEKVRELLAESSVARMNQPTFHKQTGGAKDYGPSSNRSARKMLENLEQSRAGRNPRSVLTPKPSPSGLKHFAIFPDSLIEPLIKATCPDKCCPKCGKGWTPVVKKQKAAITNSRPFSKLGNEGDRNDVGRIYEETTSNVLGYRPTCECDAAPGMKEVEVPFEPGGNSGTWAPEPIPGTVLDPFLGSGTTALVAERLGLNSISIEISREYVEMSQERICGDAPLFNKVTVEEIPS